MTLALSPYSISGPCVIKSCREKMLHKALHELNSKFLFFEKVILQLLITDGPYRGSIDQVTMNKRVVKGFKCISSQNIFNSFRLAVPWFRN